MAEPLERYARVNDRLLDGCESAYTAIADEFHADAPDFQSFVEAGAIEPELAALLDESHQKWLAAGRRPKLHVGRVNAQVLLVDASQVEYDGFVATVVFRTRELRSWAHLDAAGSAEGGGDGDAASDAVDSAGGETGAAQDAAPPTGASESVESAAEAATPEVAAMAEEPNAEAADTPEAAEGPLYEDHLQLWTFTADQPNIGPYLAWLRSVIHGHTSGHDASDAEETVDAPLRWKLVDINYCVKPYSPPAGPAEPAEAANELLMRFVLFVSLSSLLVYTVVQIFNREANRRAGRRRSPGGEASGSFGSGRLSSGPVSPKWTSGGAATGSAFAGGASGPPAVNQWGDVLNSSQHQQQAEEGGREF